MKISDYCSQKCLKIASQRTSGALAGYLKVDYFETLVIFFSQGSAAVRTKLTQFVYIVQYVHVSDRTVWLCFIVPFHYFIASLFTPMRASFLFMKVSNYKCIFQKRLVLLIILFNLFRVFFFREFDLILVINTSMLFSFAF